MKQTIYKQDKYNRNDLKNKYYSKIKLYAEKNDFNFFDIKVIKYIIDLKNNIIDKLDKDYSESDQIQLGYIKFIDEYLNDVHNYMIKQKLQIPIAIKKNKDFVYIANKPLIARHLGKKNILSRRKWIWIRDQYSLFKNDKKNQDIKEYATLIRKQLFKDKPDFWSGRIYDTDKIIDILEQQDTAINKKINQK